MTLLSRKADYALLILSYLHHRPDGGNARAIAEAYGLSRPFIANILKELCQKGFVASHRGVKGGYAILRPIATVTLSDLLESIDEGFRLTLCSQAPNGEPVVDPCNFESSCTIKGPLAEVHRRFMDVLQTTTLADILAPAGKEQREFRPVLNLPMSGESCPGNTVQPLQTAPV
ncbi:MAG: Rrf2 family transcriptional regulator [Gemmataceae bacterium]